jgi:hypothetical protein
MSIKTGYFRMTAVHPTEKTNLRFEALYDETVPNVVAGYATWETVARPHRRSLTNWTGSEPLKLQIGFILDGFAAHDAVDEDCRTLEIMAGLVADGI